MANSFFMSLLMGKQKAELLDLLWEDLNGDKKEVSEETYRKIKLFYQDYDSHQREERGNAKCSTYYDSKGFVRMTAIGELETYVDDQGKVRFAHNDELK